MQSSSCVCTSEPINPPPNCTAHYRTAARSHVSTFISPGKSENHSLTVPRAAKEIPRLPITKSRHSYRPSGGSAVGNQHSTACKGKPQSAARVEVMARIPVANAVALTGTYSHGTRATLILVMGCAAPRKPGTATRAKPDTAMCNPESMIWWHLRIQEGRLGAVAARICAGRSQPYSSSSPFSSSSSIAPAISAASCSKRPISPPDDSSEIHSDTYSSTTSNGSLIRGTTQPWVKW